jgi:hypothetical protein
MRATVRPPARRCGGFSVWADRESLDASLLRIERG